MSNSASKAPKYLTLNDLSVKLANRSRSSIYADLAAQRLPKPFKLGGRLFWIEEDIDTHLRILRDGGDA